MLKPSDVQSTKFSQVGKNGYSSTEVDAFVQLVLQTLNRLYSHNKVLAEKLDAANLIVAEYNHAKNSIADTLLIARDAADKKVEEASKIAEKLLSEATEKSEKLYDEAKTNADTYYNSKVTAADESVAKAEKELEILKDKAEAYIADVNEKARQIIEKANLKAEDIIYQANSDVEAARVAADEVVADANKELNNLKAEASKIKNEILSLISYAQKSAESVESRIFEPVAVEKEAEEPAVVEKLDTKELEPFTIDSPQIVSDITEEDVLEEQYEEITEDEDQIQVEDIQPEFVRLFDTKPTTVDSEFSGYFSSLSAMNSKNYADDDSNSFKFPSIFDEPSDMGGKRKPNPMNDSE